MDSLTSFLAEIAHRSVQRILDDDAMCRQAVERAGYLPVLNDIKDNTRLIAEIGAGLLCTTMGMAILMLKGTRPSLPAPPPPAPPAPPARFERRVIERYGRHPPSLEVGYVRVSFITEVQMTEESEAAARALNEEAAAAEEEADTEEAAASPAAAAAQHPHD